jgi:hypothetical protein
MLYKKPNDNTKQKSHASRADPLTRQPGKWIRVVMVYNLIEYSVEH